MHLGFGSQPGCQWCLTGASFEQRLALRNHDYSEMVLTAHDLQNVMVCNCSDGRLKSIGKDKSLPKADKQNRIEQENSSQ